MMRRLLKMKPFETRRREEYEEHKLKIMSSNCSLRIFAFSVFAQETYFLIP